MASRTEHGGHVSTAFSEALFVKKLTEMNQTQQSIQTLSLWLIHYRKAAKTIVQVWQTQLIQIKIKKKLQYLYLANDVIQTSRKKGPEFIKAFGGVLITAFSHVAKHADEKTLGSINRMLNIWKERRIYDSSYVDNIKKAVQNAAKVKASSSKTSKASSSSSSSTKKKSKRSAPVENFDENKTLGDLTLKMGDSPPKKTRLHELINQKDEDDYLTVIPSTTPPSAEELIKALGRLENSASSDADIRTKIHQLPTELQDVAGLDKITDRKYAMKLTKMVNEAVEMVSAYTSRLDQELNDRRHAARLLQDFARIQAEVMVDVEAGLVKYGDKLAKYDKMSQELSNHIKNLPDFTILQSVTPGLGSLPSAADLFN